MTNPRDLQTDPRVQTRLPGAWGAVNDDAVSTTGKAFIAAGLMEDGTPIEHSWVMIVNRSTSGNLLFGPDSAGAVVGLPPATTQDVIGANNWIVIYIGINGSLWLKASTGTVRGTIFRL